MKRGFTLIEVLLALSIFSVGIVIVLALFPKGISLGREAKETSVATQLAQEKIEETIELSYDDIPVGTIEARQKVETDPESQFNMYEREVLSDLLNSNLESSSTDLGLKKIEVNVYWRENAQENTVSLIRLLTKP